jgi:hypothetical protein
MISDVANSDKGDNFGRYARTGAMDAYIAQVFSEHLSGIPLASWQKFLKDSTRGRKRRSSDHKAGCSWGL